LSGDGETVVAAADVGPPSSPAWSWQRSIALAVFAVLFVTTLVVFRAELRLERLAQHELRLRELGKRHPVLTYAVAFGVYVLITGLSIPGSAILSLLYGWFFRFWGAVILVSLAATAGATVAFLFSRYLFRDVVMRRFGQRLGPLNEALAREGAFYLFALRLTPVIPYFVINALMGLTPMRVRTFWWVSQLGMLPGTFVYVYAGASAPSLEVLARDGLSGVPIAQMLLAFFLLGCFPLIARLIVRRVQRARISDA
jgi:uncharacterized membrane protein YdjX (TVP38/TMEM64 family)